MSHFTVLVIHEADENLDTLLEPFSEHMEVEPYKERIDLDEVGRAIAFYAEHPEYQNDQDLTPALVTAAQSGRIDGQLAVLRAYNGSREVGIDDDGFFSMSTYNPDSKWDWYVVGGRWGNYFDIKPECDGDEDVRRGDQPAIGEFDSTAPLKADSAPKRCIDIEGMRRREGERAGAQWDLVNTCTKGHPPIKPWSEFVALAEAGTLTWEQARAGYHGQDAVAVFRTLNTGWMDSLEDYQIDRRTYVARAEAQAIPGFATLYKGEWIEPGRMGWWGMSTDTDSTRAGYGEYVNGIIDTVSDDMIFTIVDCHI
jgi:hypothetical protein